jgi:signal transduction histidine kinase
VYNSALHLQNVIEDALDMSRLENNKFSLFNDLANIRAAIEEVTDIMRFQLNQKKLDFEVIIHERVPL